MFDLRLVANIRSARLAAAMTRDAPGRAVGVTLQQIHNHEYGEDQVLAGKLREIADALSVHLGYLVEGTSPHAVHPT